MVGEIKGIQLPQPPLHKSITEEIGIGGKSSLECFSICTQWPHLVNLTAFWWGSLSRTPEMFFSLFIGSQVMGACEVDSGILCLGKATDNGKTLGSPCGWQADHLSNFKSPELFEAIKTRSWSWFCIFLRMVLFLVQVPCVLSCCQQPGCSCWILPFMQHAWEWLTLRPSKPLPACLVS